jgi:NTP pyrophosphatase (non-canonical NTP hydrolase)
VSETDRFEALRKSLRAFVSERDWSQFHDPKNLAMAIASEAGELLAELRWVGSSEADAYVRSSGKRVQISHEAADVAIALMLFCDRAGIDLLEAIEMKITHNKKNYPAEHSVGRADRPDLNGRA